MKEQRGRGAKLEMAVAHLVNAPKLIITSKHTKLNKKMATLLKTDGTRSEVSPKNKRFTLAELYDLIGNGCDTIETVGPDMDGVTMIVDEEGKMREGLEPNWEAGDWMMKEFGVYDIVMGNVVFIPKNEMFR